METFDVIVVGGGPAGYPCAIRCSQYGLKVALIEKKDLGGCCLNRGCIPTKTLFSFAKILHSSIIDKITAQFNFDWTNVSLHVKNNVVMKLRSGVGMLLKANGVEYIQGNAEIKEPNSVIVNGNILKTKNIVLATGARVNIPEKFLQDRRILTSDTIWNLDQLPESMAIIGAGPIGCELASIFSSFGVKITIYEMLDQILPGKDREIVSLLTKSFVQKDIQIKTGVTIDSVDQIPHQIILWATGRKPDTSSFEGLNLKKISGNGIDVDEKMETSIPGIFAAGDVTGKWQLAYVATKEGETAASACAGKVRGISYENIPETIFTIPEIGVIGITQEQALSSGRKIKIGKFPYMALGKAYASGSLNGFAKIIVDAETEKILGVHIAGENATEIIHTASLAISNGLTVKDMLKSYYCHPTFSEILMEALFVCEEKPLHIPPVRK